jgi:hypothetical protein
MLTIFSVINWRPYTSKSKSKLTPISCPTADRTAVVLQSPLIVRHCLRSTTSQHCRHCDATCAGRWLRIATADKQLMPIGYDAAHHTVCSQSDRYRRRCLEQKKDGSGDMTICKCNDDAVRHFELLGLQARLGSAQLMQPVINSPVKLVLLWTSSKVACLLRA